jgi:hypothetical protein
MIFLQAATLIIGIISLVMLLKLSRKESKIMGQNDDLRQAVGELKAAVADELQRVTDELNAKKGDDPVVAQAITDLRALTASVSAFDKHEAPAPADPPPAEATTAPLSDEG